MISTDAPETKRQAGTSALVIGAALLSLFSGIIAVSAESLWIDEAHSALKAMQPTLGQWWETLRMEGGSDLQMPLYMLYLWVWEKVAGHSEAALRLANLPWFCTGQISLAFVLRRYRTAAWAAVCLGATSPFLYFYLNEARPYILQYAAACILAVVLFRSSRDPRYGTYPNSLCILAAGLLLLCASSLLGVIWAAAAGASWLYLVRGELGSLRRPAAVTILGVSAVLLLALGAFYFWTLGLGARASDVGRTGVENIGFVFYELVGAAGLGPGRLAIRLEGLAAFRDLSIIRLPLLLGLILALIRVAINLPRPAAIAGSLYVLPPLILLFAFGYAQEFRILGRHFMPLLPVIIGLFSFGLCQMRHRRLALGLFVALLATWTASSLSLRFAERHRKDDYRAAAAIATTALKANKTVWWSADLAAARYYGLSTGANEGPAALPLIGPGAADLRAAPPPDIVVASKPDIYDPQGALGEFLRARGYVVAERLPAFAIWRRPSPAPADR